MLLLHPSTVVNEPLARACSARPMVWLAVANATAVAALYWNQAVAAFIGHEFASQAALVSVVPFATLAGYAVGVALIAFVPALLRRIPVRLHLLLLGVSLLLCGSAPNVPLLAIGSVLVGIGAAAAQRLVAAAASLAGPAGAGTAIGRTIAAALLAVLGVRLAGEALASLVGWRAVLVGAGCLAGLPALFKRFPAEGGGAAVVSLDRTALRSPILRRAALQQAAAFAAYNAGWLTLLLEVPGQQRVWVVVCGGAAGLVTAMLAGRTIDRHPAIDAPLAGAAAVAGAASLLLPAAYHTAGTAHMALLLAGMALLDAGLQCALVANQARAQALQPEARCRLAALVTICGALGGAVGAGAAYLAWHQFGWTAAIAVAATASLIGFTSAVVPARSGYQRTSPSSKLPCRQLLASHGPGFPPESHSLRSATP